MFEKNLGRNLGAGFEFVEVAHIDDGVFPPEVIVAEAALRQPAEKGGLAAFVARSSRSRKPDRGRLVCGA